MANTEHQRASRWLAKVVEWSARNPFAVILVVLLLATWGWRSLRETPLDAIPDLRAAIAYCEAHKDYVSRDLFDAILQSEEEHVDWLETQLGLIEKMGMENYVQAQT